MSSYLLLYRKIRDRDAIVRGKAGVNVRINKVTGVVCEEFNLLIKRTNCPVNRCPSTSPGIYFLSS